MSSKCVIARFDVSEIPPGWYWVGKMDGEPYGPYKSENDAINAAVEITTSLSLTAPPNQAIIDWLGEQKFTL